MPPGDFGKGQFITNFIGKAANLSDELSSSQAIASGKMKRAVTRDMINLKHKFEESRDLKRKS